MAGYSFRVRSSVPLNGQTPVDPLEVQQVNALSWVKLRIKIRDGGAAASVRLWYLQDGDWWPLRADASGAAPLPVAADPTKYGGRGEGYYAAWGLSCKVIAVAETGLAADVSTCLVDAVDNA